MRDGQMDRQENGKQPLLPDEEREFGARVRAFMSCEPDIFEIRRRPDGTMIEAKLVRSELVSSKSES